MDLISCEKTFSPKLTNRGVSLVRLPGDHPFNGDYAGLVKRFADPLRC